MAVWALAPRRLSIRSWTNECVVYDDFSGDTHHLTGALSAVFLRINDRKNLSTLDLQDTPLDPPIDDASTRSELIDGALDALQDLRLIRAVEAG